MKDINKLLKQIEGITAPVKKISDPINRLSPSMRRLQKIKSSISPEIHQINKLISNLYPRISRLNKISNQAKRWQEVKKQDVAFMAENGWYPNWFTFLYSSAKGIEPLDELMHNHLNKDWKEITIRILGLCPNRAHILRNAFELHQSRNYIASIPLLLSQADGICCEMLKSFLFSGNQIEEKIIKVIDQGDITSNMLTNVFLEPFKLKNHYNSRISKHGQSAKEKAPNRNGILHGHRSHLDYGTETNSLKCFSLLSFVVYTTKELLKEAK